MEVVMNDGVKTFARAVWWGGVAGGGPFMILTVPMMLFSLSEIAPSDALSALFFAFLPLVIASVGTLAGMLAVGLPLTAMMRGNKPEAAYPYSLAGMGAGFVIPYLIFAFATGWSIEIAVGGLFLAVPGLLAGTTAATMWGAWREQVTADVADTIAHPRPDRGERWLR
jgi:hypothetical protein